MVYEALQFQRARRNASNSNAMLNYFFQRAEELAKLDNVLQLSLNSAEEKELAQFLSSPSGPKRRKELLLMYYLQRSRYSEAQAVNDRYQN